MLSPEQRAELKHWIGLTYEGLPDEQTPAWVQEFTTPDGGVMRLLDELDAAQQRWAVENLKRDTVTARYRIVQRVNTVLHDALATMRTEIEEHLAEYDEVDAPTKRLLNHLLTATLTAHLEGLGNV